MSRFVLILSLLISSAAFAAHREVDSNFARTNILVTPTNKPTSPRPLVVLLHGCKMGPEDILTVSEIEKYVDDENFSVLAPGQAVMNNLDRCWNFFDSANQMPVVRGAGLDLSTLSHLVTRTIQDSNGTIDPSRVYIAGMSAGAAMSLNLFLCDSREYQGIAMQSGVAFGFGGDIDQILIHGSGLSAAQLRAKLKKCPKSNLDTVPMVVFHGDKDTRVVEANFEDIKTQLGEQCTDELGSNPNHDFRLIPGLAHQWAGSHAHHKYASTIGPSFTEAFLRSFGILN